MLSLASQTRTSNRSTVQLGLLLALAGTPTACGSDDTLPFQEINTTSDYERVWMDEGTEQSPTQAPGLTRERPLMFRGYFRSFVGGERDFASFEVLEAGEVSYILWDDSGLNGSYYVRDGDGQLLSEMPLVETVEAGTRRMVEAAQGDMLGIGEGSEIMYVLIVEFTD